MVQQRIWRILAESLILASVPAVVSIFFPGDPGFLSIHGMPILLAGPLFTGFYGIRWGLAVALLSALLGFGAAPAILGRLDAAWLNAAAESLTTAAFLSLFTLIGAGFFKHRFDEFRSSFLTRFRRLSHRASAQARVISALEKVNRVLENRVSGQKDSITLLQNQVGKLASLNMNEALETLLETIELFTETRSASIWVPDQATSFLVPVAVRGWKEGEERDTTLDPESTIEGYVFRNRKPFSVRMILDSSEFDRFDESRNVITMPILIKDKPWGVLNIEDLPFERYSLYTESVLSILLGLAEPYLRSITDYEFLHEQSEVDPDTGFPQYPVLWARLEKELERRSFEPGSVSLIVVEMANFEESLATIPRAKLKRHLFQVVDAFGEANRVKYQAYHFKSDSQFAFLVPDLDQDGASFLCLDLLTLCSSLELPLDGEKLPLEMIVGFASSSEGSLEANTLVDKVEHLLSIQRL